jgi:DNA polymerase III gamma/tau subunit
VFDSGKDVSEVLGSLVALTRTLLLLQAGAGDTRALDLAADEAPRLMKTSQLFGLQGLVYLAELLTDCRQRVRRAAYPRVVVETTFVKLSMLGRLESLETLLMRLDDVPDAPNPAPAQEIRSNPAPAPAASSGPNEREQAALEAIKRQFRAK